MVFIATGTLAVDRYLNKSDQKKWALTGVLRKHARAAGFLPETATTSRALALHVMTANTTGNLICPYHHRYDKAGVFCDSKGGKLGKYDFTGTPGERNLNIPKEGVVVVPPQGYMHCGCEISPVLLEFYLWKTTELYSPFFEGKEGWMRELLDPRQRALTMTAFTEWTTLTVDDLYNRGSDGKERLSSEVIGIQIERLTAKKRKMEVREELHKKAQDNMDWLLEGRKVKKAKKASRKAKTEEVVAMAGPEIPVGVPA